MSNGLPLFAYGTLMFPEVIAAVIGRVPLAQPASAAGFERREVAGQLYPGLVRSARDDAVRGLLYKDLAGNEWDRLNAYEGDFYELTEIPVACEGREEAALAYLVPDARSSLLGKTRWDPETFRRRHLPSYLAGTSSGP